MQFVLFIVCLYSNSFPTGDMYTYGLFFHTGIARKWPVKCLLFTMPDCGLTHTMLKEVQTSVFLEGVNSLFDQDIYFKSMGAEPLWHVPQTMKC